MLNSQCNAPLKDVVYVNILMNGEPRIWCVSRSAYEGIQKQAREAHERWLEALAAAERLHTGDSNAC